MGWLHLSDKHNPWGQPGNQNRGGGRKGSGSNGRGGSNGPEQPDLDELLRQAREQFGGGMGGQSNFIPLIIIVIIGLWFASGIYFVQPGERGVVQRFGDWNRTKVTEGMGYHLPSPIETVTVINVNNIRKLEIGYREVNTRRGGSAIRDVADESLMLTSDANIVDLDLEVQWNISAAEDFLFQIRDVESTIKKVAESAIREVVGQTQLQRIITTGRDAVSQRVKQIMQDNLDQYKAGVNIVQVLIQDATVHPDVIPAFEDVVAALQDAETFQNEATIYANDIIPKARGEAIQLVQEAEAYRESRVARASGDAQRFNEIYAAYVSGKNVTRERLYLETMEKIMSRAQKIIIDQEEGSSGVVPYLPLNEINRKSGNTQ